MEVAPNHKQHGYTLIEMLIVLSIIMIISTVTFLHLTSVANEKKIDYFFEQLTDDLLLAQINAISYGQVVNIFFSDKDQVYKINMPTTGRTLVKRHLPPMFELNTMPIGGRLSYLANGGINKSGTIRISYKDRDFSVIFLLGEGRFYVKEV